MLHRPNVTFTLPKVFIHAVVPCQPLLPHAHHHHAHILTLPISHAQICLYNSSITFTFTRAYLPSQVNASIFSASSSEPASRNTRTSSNSTHTARPDHPARNA